MPSAVITSDWHADAVTAGFERFEDVEAAVGEVVGAVHERKPDLFVFLGDLCDPNTSRSHRAVALATRVAVQCNALGVTSLWLVGNHDVVDDGHGTHTLVALKQLGGLVHVLDRPAAGVVPRTGMATEFVALPFTSRTAPYDAEAYVRDVAAARKAAGRKAPPVVLSHLSAPLLRVGSESASLARGRDFRLPVEALGECFPGALLLQGHYHRRQRAELAGGVEVHVPGALERLRFDEADHAPGYLVVEWEEG